MTPRKGDRVRVTINGEYRHSSKDLGWHRVMGASGRTYQISGDDATIEVLEDLRPGDVYRTGEGWTVVVLHLGSEGIYAIHPESPRSWWTVENLPRPLTLLVRDGKPVTS